MNNAFSHEKTGRNSVKKEIYQKLNITRNKLHMFFSPNLLIFELQQ